MNIIELKELILNNFSEFCDVIKNKFNVVGLSSDMLDLDDEEKIIYINIEDDAECVEYIYLTLTNDESETECNLNDVLFYAFHFYDAMD